MNVFYTREIDREQVMVCLENGMEILMYRGTSHQTYCANTRHKIKIDFLHDSALDVYVMTEIPDHEIWRRLMQVSPEQFIPLDTTGWHVGSGRTGETDSFESDINKAVSMMKGEL